MQLLQVLLEDLFFYSFDLSIKLVTGLNLIQQAGGNVDFEKSVIMIKFGYDG